MKIHNEVIYSNINILKNLKRINLPHVSIKSNIPGPKICLTAGVHGDEIGGCVIVQELINKLHKNQIIRGELHAFPMLNPSGFEESTRFLNGEDLNRVFPGKENGTMAQRTAYLIFKKILEDKPELVIDIHNDWRKSIQYAAIDPKPNSTSKEIYQQTEKFAKSLAIPLILDTDGITNSLSYHLLKNNISSIVLELGAYQIVKEREIDQGVNILLKILKDFDMIEKDIGTIEEDNRIKGKILKYSQEPMPKRKGIARFSIVPGQIVKKGQILIKIYSPLGNLLEVIKSPYNALVLGYSDSSLALPGQQLIALGVIK